MKWIRLLPIGLAIVLPSLVYLGCSSPTSQKAPPPVIDSMAIALDMIAKDTSLCRRIVTFAGENYLKQKFTEPMDWDMILDRMKWYKADPALWMPKKNPRDLNEVQKYYEGFKIDAKGWTILTSHKDYEELYIRLGRNRAGEYNFILMPMKGGKLVQQGPKERDKEEQNLDHLEPCPGTGCPEGFTEQ